MSEEVTVPMTAWEGRQFLAELSERKPVLAAIVCGRGLALATTPAQLEALRKAREALVHLAQESPVVAARYVQLKEQQRVSNLSTA